MTEGTPALHAVRIIGLLAMAPFFATADERTQLYAEVVRVKPLVEVIKHSRPVKSCQWMLPTPFDRRVRRCTTREVEETRERVRSYHVTYRIENETFSAHVDYHPGSTILVNARITPLNPETEQGSMQVAKNTQADVRPDK